MPDQSHLVPKPAVRPGAVLAVLSVAAFMASLDLFIVNVAFDQIGRDFSGVSLSDLSWVLNGYAIVYAALLVPLGRVADRFGRKPGFLLGLAVFTVASLACALSGGPWMLVGFRTLQAVGAALLTPTSLGLLVSATPPAGRGRVVRIWGAGGRGRPRRGRRPRRGVLALGLPGEPAHRRRGAAVRRPRGTRLAGRPG